MTQTITQAMTDSLAGQADVTLSGRELAMQRRQAMARLGKAGAGKIAAGGKSLAMARSAAHVVPAQAAGTAVNMTMPAPTVNPARVATPPTGRALAQARRAVLAKEGKAGLKRVAQAVKIAAALPEQNWQAAISQGATGRQIAMQHRLVQSLTGRAGGEISTRPAGRMRPTVAKGESPVKVEEGHTLSGQRVTGTMVERSKLVTGNEPGAVRAITGTEYVGAEQFERQGVARPRGAPAKVIASETARGKTVTGALVGRSPKVTGDEVGATRALTGTAYLGAAAPAAAPDKVAVTHTAQGRSVTGTMIGHGARMTGDERGGCARVTGTEYLSAEQVRGECAVEPRPGPSKVSVMSSRGDQQVSGVPVGRSARVTGDEPGACRPITGSQYFNQRDFAELCPPSSSPRRGASVLSRPVRQEGVPAGGDDYPKSGGDAGLEAACATAHPFGLHASPVRAAVAVIPAAAVSGDRPGAGGAVLTGDERGACLPVSGTPYIGADNAPAECPMPASGRFLSRVSQWHQEEMPAAPLDFSIVSPARAAQYQRGSTLTGAVVGDDRITGPVNKAGGLITGTPDFRHRAATLRATGEDAGTAASRLSGEGAQSGTCVTGDAWQAKSRVTGTEGASALTRNPSQRGTARGAGAGGAREFRSIERQPVPESRVTGSSGNTMRGALVTVSGGARA